MNIGTALAARRTEVIGRALDDEMDCENGRGCLLSHEAAAAVSVAEPPLPVSATVAAVLRAGKLQKPPTARLLSMKMTWWSRNLLLRLRSDAASNVFHVLSSVIDRFTLP